MSRVTSLRGLAALGLLALLAGCATHALRDARPAAVVGAQAGATEAERVAWMARHRDWSLTGRVAVSKGGKGGSGRIEWQQAGDAYTVTLSAPVTRQSWRLTGDTHSEAGRLEGLDGGPREGEFADDLLLEATGWDVPVNQLPSWMRGSAAPGLPVEGLTFDAEGRPLRLLQAGWIIDYTRWAAPVAGRPSLPSRIEAKRGDGGVKLVIDNWSFAQS